MSEAWAPAHCRPTRERDLTKPAPCRNAKSWYSQGDQTFPGVPLDRCDLEAARAGSSEIDAFLFWSRTPYIVPKEDGTLWLQDARFSDPRAVGRFEVQLSDGVCEGVRTEPGEGAGG